MFEISSEITFSAAHRLINYNGPCENIHGHNWKICAFVRCSELHNSGISLDFKDLKSALKEIAGELDHKDLNNVMTGQDGLSPSSENIAKYFYDRLKKSLDRGKCRLHRIDVYETPVNRASYFEDD